MRRPPHPPDETADDLRAALVRNHPELSSQQIAALLAGTPNKTRFRPSSDKRRGWSVGKRAKTNVISVHPRGRRKR